MAERTRNPVADRLWDTLKAAIVAWEDLENEVGYRLEEGRAWEDDLDERHQAAVKADRELREALSDALDQLKQKGLGL